MLKTTLYEKHVELGAKMVDFEGWNMPLYYKDGIVKEHLETRKTAGLFDVSHMGRFIIKGNDSLPFLQKILTNNAAALQVGESQYTLIQNESGGTIDDAYLYYFKEGEYILVVNASNREKDMKHLIQNSKSFYKLEIIDKTFDTDLISLQGPLSKKILLELITSGDLPDPLRNKLSIAYINNIEVLIGRTGYTGEPLCYELFFDKKYSKELWDKILSKGAHPVGLGARDTLRLEAGLPLYGHELNENIHIFSSPLSKFAVSFSTLKGEFIGKEELLKQFEALKKIEKRDYSQKNDLPKIVVLIEIMEKSVARPNDKIFKGNRQVGYVTSGTVVPYWEKEGEGIFTKLTEKFKLRPICLGIVDVDIWERDYLEVEIRDKKIKAVVMPYFLRSEAPPYAYAINSSEVFIEKQKKEQADIKDSLRILIEKAINNNQWRQKECINLIPSEMTPSKLVKALSILDPSGRYAEHKKVKAYSGLDVFYYQGVNFIAEVEELLKSEFMRYFCCKNVEVRDISGQMANTTVFGGLVDYLNATDKRTELKKLEQVLNHHIIKGGHLSAQPMGALKDYIAINKITEKPAVIDFPVCPDNPYKTDVEKTKEIIIRYKPTLIIFGKSMVLHKEPVKEIKDFLIEQKINSLIMYDMAHVLGLVGQYFQEPFREGADIITGSTHKTFFGTQRGVIASDFLETDVKYKLWEAIENRTFPGSVSNHHLGTMLGLLGAAYEMNYFKNEYQKKVIANAKCFANALKNNGLKMGGDPSISYTETHQVILEVGFTNGIEIANKLEENNILTNYQATSEEEGFTAAGAIRMGVSEMTRFGMEEKDFEELSSYIAEIILKGKNLKKQIIDFRKRFIDMKFCFDESNALNIINNLFG
ncbi:MAG: glycine cleavage system aminomethyltransferase GcvT [Actinomycetota bacterium]|nr:glycine cleavage system aminomethyltransferase GcvT [Actinomycetota bacterium]